MRRMGALVFMFLLASSMNAETAWVTMVNPEKNIVELQVVGAKINLLVQFQDVSVLGVSPNGIAGFYFVCGEDKQGKCDPGIPFKIQLNAAFGNILAWKFLVPVEKILVGQSTENPSDNAAFCTGKMGNYKLWLALWNDDSGALKKATIPPRMVNVVLPEADPHSAYLNNVLFRILNAAVENP